MEFSSSSLSTWLTERAANGEYPRLLICNIFSFVVLVFSKRTAVHGLVAAEQHLSCLSAGLSLCSLFISISVLGKAICAQQRVGNVLAFLLAFLAYLFPYIIGGFLVFTYEHKWCYGLYVAFCGALAVVHLYEWSMEHEFDRASYWSLDTRKYNAGNFKILTNCSLLICSFYSAAILLNLSTDGTIVSASDFAGVACILAGFATTVAAHCKCSIFLVEGEESRSSSFCDEVV